MLACTPPHGAATSDFVSLPSASHPSLPAAAAASSFAERTSLCAACPRTLGDIASAVCAANRRA